MNISTTTTSENIKNKIVNVRGIPIDISSILNDVTASIQNNIQNSLDGALKDYELYKSTHDAVLQIPFVRDLCIQNQELISQLELSEQQNSQHIKLKINEISPPPSPVTMQSHNQFNPYNYHSAFENKKLHSELHDEEKSNSNDSYSSESRTSDSDAEEEEEEEVTTSESESEEEEEESEKEEENEEEEEVYEIVIKNVTYFTTNEENGDIYECVHGDVGEIVGKFKNKKPIFKK